MVRPSPFADQPAPADRRWRRAPSRVRPPPALAVAAMDHRREWLEVVLLLYSASQPRGLIRAAPPLPTTIVVPLPSLPAGGGATHNPEQGQPSFWQAIARRLGQVGYAAVAAARAATSSAFLSGWGKGAVNAPLVLPPRLSITWSVILRSPSTQKRRLPSSAYGHLGKHIGEMLLIDPSRDTRREGRGLSLCGAMRRLAPPFLAAAGQRRRYSSRWRQSPAVHRPATGPSQGKRFQQQETRPKAFARSSPGS